MPRAETLAETFAALARRAALLALLAVAPAAAAEDLGRGVNLFHSDGIFTAGDGTRFDLATFPRLKALGFGHVRFATRPFADLDADGRPTERWVGVLRNLIDKALAARLQVIVDVHESFACAKDRIACERRLAATWTTLGARLADYDDRVVFEILNEPDGAVDPVTWNRLADMALRIIRVKNPTRRVVIGPAASNHFTALGKLSLPPDDRNLIVGVHYYEPFAFTHQGTHWTNLKDATGVEWGSAEDIARLERDFDTIRAWAKAEKRPVLIGEFGAYERGDSRSRFCWTYRVARAAEARGWSWSYWQLATDFALMDEVTGRWNDWLIAALIAPANPETCRAPTPGRPRPSP